MPAVLACCVPGCLSTSKTLESWSGKNCSYHKSIITKPLGNGEVQVFHVPVKQGEPPCTCSPPFALYSFPRAEKRRNAWIGIIRAKTRKSSDWTPKRQDKICSYHFKTGKPSENDPFPNLDLMVPGQEQNQRMQKKTIVVAKSLQKIIIPTPVVQELSPSKPPERTAKKPEVVVTTPTEAEGDTGAVVVPCTLQDVEIVRAGKTRKSIPNKLRTGGKKKKKKGRVRNTHLGGSTMETSPHLHHPIFHRNSPGHCVVVGCGNTEKLLISWLMKNCLKHGVPNYTGDCDCKPPFHLYSFPRSADMRRDWLELLNRATFVNGVKVRNWSLRSHSRVCSKHFEKNTLYPTLFMGYGPEYGDRYATYIYDLEKKPIAPKTSNCSGLDFHVSPDLSVYRAESQAKNKPDQKSILRILGLNETAEHPVDGRNVQEPMESTKDANVENLVEKCDDATETRKENTSVRNSTEGAKANPNKVQIPAENSETDTNVQKPGENSERATNVQKSAGNSKTDTNVQKLAENSKTDTNVQRPAGNSETDKNVQTPAANSETGSNVQKPAGNSKTDKNVQKSAGNSKTDKNVQKPAENSKADTNIQKPAGNSKTDKNVPPQKTTKSAAVTVTVSGDEQTSKPQSSPRKNSGMVSLLKPLALLTGKSAPAMSATSGEVGLVTPGSDDQAAGTNETDHAAGIDETSARPKRKRKPRKWFDETSDEFVPIKRKKMSPGPGLTLSTPLINAVLVTKGRPQQKTSVVFEYADDPDKSTASKSTPLAIASLRRVPSADPKHDILNVELIQQIINSSSATTGSIGKILFTQEQCCVIGCTIKERDVFAAQEQHQCLYHHVNRSLCKCQPLKLNQFPKDSDECLKWRKLINRKDFASPTPKLYEPQPGDRVCSKHFVHGEPNEFYPYPTLKLGYEEPRSNGVLGSLFDRNKVVPNVVVFKVDKETRRESPLVDYQACKLDLKPEEAMKNINESDCLETTDGAKNDASNPGQRQQLATLTSLDLPGNRVMNVYDNLYGILKFCKCADCGEKFSASGPMADLMAHIKRCQLKPCFACPEQFGSTTALSEHLRTHLTCNGCKIAFKTYTEYKHHCSDTQCEHTATFPCPICAQTFPGLFEMDRHAMAHGYIFRRSCLTCDISFQTQKESKEHQHTVHGNAYRCKICGKTYVDEKHGKSLLKSHIRTHDQVYEFECEICSKRFCYKSLYKKHLRSHASPEEQFRCSHCNKSLSSQDRLDKHEMLHRNSSSVLCSVCGKTFKSQKTFREHKKNHEAQQGLCPFKCHRCGERFSKQSELRVHKSMRHPSLATSWR